MDFFSDTRTEMTMIYGFIYRYEMEIWEGKIIYYVLRGGGK